MRKMLTIRRKAYTRKAHTRKAYTRKDGTRVRAAVVKASYVGASTFERRDVGAPGRGPRVLPKLRKGVMIKEAVRIGLLSQKDVERGKRVSNLSQDNIVKLAEHLRKKYGQRRAWGMFHAQVIYRKRMSNGFKKKMMIGREVAKGKPGEWD